MPAKPIKVAITFCVECGYSPQALELAATLVKSLHYNLSSVELIPWHDGAFDVTVGDDLVHSMLRDGGFPEPKDIVQAARDRLAA